MNVESAEFLLCLKALHGISIVCWMAGQVWMWRAERALLHVRGRVNRRVLGAATTLAATLALSSGAGLLVL